MSNHCLGSVLPPIQLSIFSLVLAIFLCLIIVIGNGLIFVAVYKDPFHRLRTPFSYFLVNLAISDFVLGIVTMPLSVQFHLSEINANVSHPNPVAIHLSFFITSTASVLSMGALCFDRYTAVAVRLNHRRGLSRCRCVSMSIAIWVISVASSMLYFVVGYVTMLVVIIHSTFIITLCMMVITYAKVYKVFMKLAKDLGTRRGPNTNGPKAVKKRNIANKERQVTQTFLVLLLLFVICYFPVIVIAYVLELCHTCSCESLHVLRDLELLLICMNSAINPLACIFRLKVYRRSICLAIRCADKERIEIECSQISGGSSTPAPKPKPVAAWSRKCKVQSTSSGSRSVQKVSPTVRIAAVPTATPQSQASVNLSNSLHASSTAI